MDSSFHLSFLIVPTATVVETESRLLGILLLCNSLSGSLLIGCLGLGGGAVTEALGAILRMHPGQKDTQGAWWITLSSCRDHWLQYEMSFSIIFVNCILNLFVHLNAFYIVWIVYYPCVQESEPDSISQDRHVNRQRNRARKNIFLH